MATSEVATEATSGRYIKSLAVSSLLAISTGAWADTGTTLCQVVDEQGQEEGETYLFHNDTVIKENSFHTQIFKCVERKGVVSIERQCRVEDSGSAFHIVKLDRERNLIIRAMGNHIFDNYGVWVEDVVCSDL